jgi:hypothetical protein
MRKVLNQTNEGRKKNPQIEKGIKHRQSLILAPECLQVEV